MQKYQTRLSGLLFIILFMQGSVSATVSFPWVGQSRHDEKECNKVMNGVLDKNAELQTENESLKKAVRKMFTDAQAIQVATKKTEDQALNDAKEAKIKWFCIGAVTGVIAGAVVGIGAGLGFLASARR